METIKRENYLSRIRPYYDSLLIKVITGIRRCGKSEILKQIMKEIENGGVDKNHIIYLDLESIQCRNIKSVEKLENAVVSLIKDENKYYIFIDEIQNIPKFEIGIAAIRNSLNCSLFVTGSNSKLLAGKLQDRLTGRAKEFEVYPFTYNEYLEYKNINGIKLTPDDFRDYLRFGGMPQRFEEANEIEIRKYLIGLHSSIIKKDVYGSHKRIDKVQFKTVAEYISSTSGRLFSALSAAKKLKENLTREEQRSFSNLINKYAEYLKECYLITECKPAYLKGKERLNGTRKFYPIDVGIRMALGNAYDYDDTFALEAVIYNELLTRGYEVYYGKLRDNSEIDFVAMKNGKKCFIQVAYVINSQEVKDREYGAFDTITDGSPRYVLSLDQFDSSTNGATHLYIIDFLLGKVDIHLS